MNEEKLLAIAEQIMLYSTETELLDEDIDKILANIKNSKKRTVKKENKVYTRSTNEAAADSMERNEGYGIYCADNSIVCGSERYDDGFVVIPRVV